MASEYKYFFKKSAVCQQVCYILLEVSLIPAHEKDSTFLREINSRRAAKPFTATEIYDIAPVIRITFMLHVVL